jgi:hypothetical protein
MIHLIASMAQSLQEFESIILGILTPDQDVHHASETKYFQLEQNNRDTLIQLLAMTLKNPSSNPSARIFSAVILRQQSLPSKQLLTRVSPQTVEILKVTALDLFQNESNPTIRSQVIEFAAVLAATLFRSVDTNQLSVWPEILQVTYQGCGLTTHPAIQCACFNMVSLLAEYSTTIFADQTNILIPLLGQSMQTTTPIEVAISTASTCLSLITSFQQLSSMLSSTSEDTEKNQIKLKEIKSIIAEYAQAVPQCCQIFARALNEKREGLTSGLLSAMSDVISTQPEVFKSALSDLLPLINTIAFYPDLESSFRSRCVELLISFGASPASRAVARKNENFQKTILAIAFQLILDIDYTTEWAEDPLYMRQDEDDWPNYYLGLLLFKQIPVILGAKVALPVIFTEAFHRVKNPDWKQAHATLSIISIYYDAEFQFRTAIPKPITTSIRTLFGSITEPTVLSKANKRLIAKCFEAITQFAPFLTPLTTKPIFHHILHFLSAPVVSTLPTTVIYEALRALAASFGGISAKTVKPQLPEILTLLTTQLNHPSSVVTNSAFTAITTLSCCVQEELVPYMTFCCSKKSNC